MTSVSARRAARGLGLSLAVAACATVAPMSAHAATPVAPGVAMASGNVYMRSGTSTSTTPVEVVTKGHAVAVTGTPVGIWAPVTDGAKHGFVSVHYLTMISSTPMSYSDDPPMSTKPAPSAPVTGNTTDKMLPLYYTPDASAYADILAASHVQWPGGVTSNGTALARAVHANFPQVAVMGGYRDEAGSDHDTGHAIDFMLPGNYKLADRKALGAAIAEYVQTNYAALHVKYVIYQQHIWGEYRSSEGWRQMADRGNDTQNHKDHVHISFY